MGGWSGLGSDAVLTYVAMFIVFPPFPSEDMLYTGRLSFCHGILPLLLRLLPLLPAAPLPLPMPPLLMHILSPPKHKALDRRASAHTPEHAIATITAQILGVILLADLIISSWTPANDRPGGVDENGRGGLDNEGCVLGMEPQVWKSATAMTQGDMDRARSKTLGTGSIFSRPTPADLLADRVDDDEEEEEEIEEQEMHMGNVDDDNDDDGDEDEDEDEGAVRRGSGGGLIHRRGGEVGAIMQELIQTLGRKPGDGRGASQEGVFPFTAELVEKEIGEYEPASVERCVGTVCFFNRRVQALGEKRALLLMSDGMLSVDCDGEQMSYHRWLAVTRTERGDQDDDDGSMSPPDKRWNNGKDAESFRQWQLTRLANLVNAFGDGDDENEDHENVGEGEEERGGEEERAGEGAGEYV